MIGWFPVVYNSTYYGIVQSFKFKSNAFINFLDRMAFEPAFFLLSFYYEDIGFTTDKRKAGKRNKPQKV